MNWSKATAVILTVGAILGTSLMVLQLTEIRLGTPFDAFITILYFTFGTLQIAVGFGYRRKLDSLFLRGVLLPSGVLFLLIGAGNLNVTVDGSATVTMAVMGVMVAIMVLMIWNIIRMKRAYPRSEEPHEELD